MKKPIILIMLLVMFSHLLQLYSCGEKRGTDPELQALYDTLDHEIAISDTYDSIKSRRIEALHHRLRNSREPGDDIDILKEIVAEYESYNADSALHYADRALELTGNMEDTFHQKELLMKKADIYAHAGLFPNAFDIMAPLRIPDLPEELHDEYYSTYNLIYQYLCEYVEGSQSADEYARMRDNYADSLKMVAIPGTFDYAVYCLSSQARSGNPADAGRAIADVKKQLENYAPGDRRYSILASIISDMGKNSGHTDDYRRYIVMSAISDVKGAIKENMSFREAANAAMADGDVERANRYLKKSFEDANWYSARMRKDQSSKILPAIDESYAGMQKRMVAQQRGFTVAISVLAVILGILAVISMRQTIRVRRSNVRMNEANADLSRMSAELKNANERLEDANSRLAETNLRLTDSNLVKEQYAGMFMEACSATISILQKYHSSLVVLVNQGGVSSKIARKIESREFIDSAVKDFYLKFDEAILNIYPEFPLRVNELLLPGEQLKTKCPGQLNTELRVLALIRIGITDNAKIAEFLRCSITTVYTYRSKVRKRSRDPENFENQVKLIYA